ncbi:MAG: T9SS type A sorting domain-containing protein, partial [Bacteroidota bacterium]
AFNIDEITFTLETTATEEEAIAAGFLVSPNPVMGRLQVQLPSSGWRMAESRLELFGADGRFLRSFPVAGSQTELDFTGQVAGTYFLLLTDGTRAMVRRIVK